MAANAARKRRQRRLMAEIHFKRLKIIGGSYLSFEKVTNLTNLKAKEASRLNLLLMEYVVMSGDIGTNNKKRLAAARREMKRQGHTLVYR